MNIYKTVLLIYSKAHKKDNVYTCFTLKTSVNNFHRIKWLLSHSSGQMIENTDNYYLYQDNYIGIIELFRYE